MRWCSNTITMKTLATHPATWAWALLKQPPESTPAHGAAAVAFPHRRHLIIHLGASPIQSRSIYQAIVPMTVWTGCRVSESWAICTQVRAKAHLSHSWQSQDKCVALFNWPWAQGWRRLKTRPPVALGWSTELFTFNMSLATQYSPRPHLYALDLDTVSKLLDSSVYLVSGPMVFHDAEEEEDNQPDKCINLHIFERLFIQMNMYMNIWLRIHIYLHVVRARDCESLSPTASVHFV